MTVPIAQYVNTGAPFQREDGSWVKTLEQFAASAKEIRQFQYKLRLVVASGELPSPTAPSDYQGGAAARPWPMPMTPALYLQVAPEGEHAALARQLVAPDVTESVPTESVSDAHD